MPVRPPSLSPQATVRVVSPSLPSMAFAGPRVEHARTAMEALGLRVEFSSNCYAISDDGWSAGEARIRAHDINEAFRDPNVNGVIAAVGGKTTSELLPYLDIDAISANPKIFVGRSDNIYLNAILLEKAGLVSFYGVTFLHQFGDYPRPMRDTMSSFVRVLMDNRPITYPLHRTRFVRMVNWAARDGQSRQTLSRLWRGQVRWLRKGRSTGVIVGGELTLVVDMAEKGLIDLRDKIFFWDTNSDDPFYADRYFGELSRLTDLRALRGMIIGDNPCFPFDEWVTTVSRLLRGAVAEVSYPVMIGGECGHYDPVWVLPYGDVVTLDSASGLTYRDHG